MADEIAILVRVMFEEVVVELVTGTPRVTDRWCWDKALSTEGEKVLAIIIIMIIPFALIYSQAKVNIVIFNEKLFIYHRLQTVRNKNTSSD